MTIKNAISMALIFGMILIIFFEWILFKNEADSTFAFITDTSQPDIWVMNPGTRFIEDIKPLKSTDVYRIRGVEGVLWAVPIYHGVIEAQLENGIFQKCILIGIDDFSLIGGPSLMIEGKVEDLKIPDTIIIDALSAKTKLAGISPLQIGDRIELNEHFSYVTGICQTIPRLDSLPIIYTTLTRAVSFIPTQRKALSFVIAHTKEGEDPKELCERIIKQTGLSAYTPDQLKELTLSYYTEEIGFFKDFKLAIFLSMISSLLAIFAAILCFFSIVKI